MIAFNHRNEHFCCKYFFHLLTAIPLQSSKDDEKTKMKNHDDNDDNDDEPLYLLKIAFNFKLFMFLIAYYLI